MSWTAMVTVGRIVRPHGLAGHVIVASETDFPDVRFEAGQSLYVGRAEGDTGAAMTIAVSRAHQGRWIVGFDGVSSVDDAETLRGCELRIPAATLQPLTEGAYYLHDLVGCEVTTTAGQRVGVVREVDLNAGTPVLVVGGSEGETDVLVPFVDAICTKVDVTGKRIEIAPLPGLIELNARRTQTR